MSKDRFKLVPYIVVILRDGKKVLLIKRCNTNFSCGLYALPGGGVDGDETITAATIREAYEELGVKIDQKDLKFVHVYHAKPGVAGQSEYINFFFEAIKWEGEPVNMEPHKCEEMVWFDLDALPENIIPAHRHALEMIEKNIVFSEFGWEK